MRLMSTPFLLLSLLVFLGNFPRAVHSYNECLRNPSLSHLISVSELVLEASVTSKSEIDAGNQFGVTFTVKRVFKGRQSLKYNYIRLNFSAPNFKKWRKRREPCVGRHKRIHKANIQPGKKYFLFLNELINLRFTSSGRPMKKNKDNFLALKNILSSTQYEPHIKNLQDTNVNEGETIKLKCKVKDEKKRKAKRRKLTINWFKDGKPLYISNRIKIFSKSMGKNTTRSVLRIRNATKSDAGSYECQAYSGQKLGKSSATVTIDSKRKISFSSFDESTMFRHGSKCPIESYCLNGGHCIYYKTLGELTCQCASGYRGKRCEHKDLYDRAVSFNQKMGLSPICILGLTHYPC